MPFIEFSQVIDIVSVCSMAGIIVDDYTRRGLFNHLQLHEGRALDLCAHEEMSALFDIIQKRFSELLDWVVIIIDSYELDLVTPIRHYFSQ